MTPESQQMIEYIVQLTRKPGLSIDENTPLVSSGLIDSMALVDLLLKLEDLTNPFGHDPMVVEILSTTPLGRELVLLQTLTDI